MHIFSFSLAPYRFLRYGSFLLLCHVTAILFLVTTSPYVNGDVLFHRFFPMLEHSLISFVALLFGFLGIEYIVRKSPEK